MAWSARVQALMLITIAAGASCYEVEMNIGDAWPIQIPTGISPLVPCYLLTPKGETIEFRPENQSTERIKYIENIVSYCGANITSLIAEDEGVWKLYFINTSGDKVEQTYHLTIIKDGDEEKDSSEVKEPEKVEETVTEKVEEDSAEPEKVEEDSIEHEEEEEESDEVNTEWLTLINISTRSDMTIDISLSKKDDASQEEKFTIITPQNVVVPLEEANIAGLTVHGSSEFVASRVTIGPMAATLIGRWTLCGEISTGEPVRRCQPVAISWNNIANPSEDWEIHPLDQRDIVTNYMSTVDTTITGYGAVTTVMVCHLITPDGEDLVLTADSSYPGITLVPSRDSPDCRVQMSIHEEFIGDWILYGTFRARLDGVHEIRLPLHLFLYDEENPYSQAYNVTNLDPVNRVINLGTTTELEITGSGTVDSCEVRSPSGQIFNLQNTAEPVTFLDTESRIACAVAIGPIAEDTLGDWNLFAKFSDKGIFTERRQTLSIIQEDPENPIVDENRIVLNRDTIVFNTVMGAEHTVITDPDALWIYTTESCHLRTPSGRQYTLMDGFNLPGIEIVEAANNRCSVKVTVESEDMVGEWVLISREDRSWEAVEVRQPFTIYVKELVGPSTSQVIVTEGNDLHLRLANPTELHDTCKLYDPEGNERTDLEVDVRESCGFIVRNVQIEDSGIWEIHYGTGISYIAQISVQVNDIWESSHDTIVLPRGRSVNKTLGPETAIYCKLEDPSQSVVFDGFGPCILALNRVANNHAGTWVMSVGFQGSLLLREYHITANVRGSEDKPIVTTHVAKEQPHVTLSCSVPVEYEVRSCLFREPSGRVILANEGVAQDRYSFHGAGTTVDTVNVTTHECGLRIDNPEVEDLGLWRCAVQTDHDVYYGFLTVLCPWAMQDPSVAAAVVSEPTLTTHQEHITHMEGDSLTMSCSIQSPIKYCYFRRPNGMTYSVAPGIISDEYEYVGAGLDAGECGIRFTQLLSQEAGHWPEGRWSCHVGLPANTEPEQRVTMQVDIIRPIDASQYMNAGHLVVIGEVYHHQSLDYCRYVRIDGQGFTTDTLPDSRYISNENLSGGRCGLIIHNPTILDMHPWTIAARIVKTDDEILDVTNHSMEAPPSVPPSSSKSIHIWWWLTMLTGVVLICVGVLIMPPKNRKKTIARTTAWRDSIRRSFKKVPLANDHTRSTPMSA